MEGLALTGAWVDKEKGLLSLIALEMGTSTRLLSSLKPGQRVIVMGPTGTPTEIPENETVLLAGGGLGNAVLFSIAKALKSGGFIQQPQVTIAQLQIRKKTVTVLGAVGRAGEHRGPLVRVVVAELAEELLEGLDGVDGFAWLGGGGHVAGLSSAWARSSVVGDGNATFARVAIRTRSSVRRRRRGHGDVQLLRGGPRRGRGRRPGVAGLPGAAIGGTRPVPAVIAVGGDGA